MKSTLTIATLALLLLAPAAQAGESPMSSTKSPMTQMSSTQPAVDEKALDQNSHPAAGAMSVENGMAQPEMDYPSSE